MRVYQGTLKKGQYVRPQVEGGRRVRVSKLVKMNSNDFHEVDHAVAGDIVAMVGVECASGTTFIDDKNPVPVSLSSMHIPEPVLSYAIRPKSSDMNKAFAAALNKFSKEDPTFRIDYDKETEQTLISGMGELHLDIYVERMKREYKVECIVGQPLVNYRETLAAPASFDYTHKKQSGGAGQYARVMGRLEPMPIDDPDAPMHEFENLLVGNNIPPEYVSAVAKGFVEGLEKGPLTGSRVIGVRFLIEDGVTHEVDSSELAFRAATQGALKQGIEKGGGQVLQPMMRVEVDIPAEKQGAVISALSRRNAQLQGTETDEHSCRIYVSSVLSIQLYIPTNLTTCLSACLPTYLPTYLYRPSDQAVVPLADMFGYSTELRSMTEGMGEFSMEYLNHQPVQHNVQQDLVEEYQRKRRAGEAK
ncbi:MAG: hypothetical protein MHM6MM_008452 [Cercozoa sp. M6MM]